jgi:hypothetical protein
MRATSLLAMLLAAWTILLWPAQRVAAFGGRYAMKFELKTRDALDRAEWLLADDLGFKEPFSVAEA